MLVGLVNVDRKRGMESYLHSHGLPPNFIIPVLMCVEFLFLRRLPVIGMSCPVFTILAQVQYSALETVL